MPDIYRLPDNPIARRLEAARVALEQERAAQEERDRANQAAVEDLRAVLAAMDPPLEAHVRPPHPHYTGPCPPDKVLLWAPTAGEGYVVCDAADASWRLEHTAGTAEFARKVSALLEAERAAIARAAQQALEPPPEVVAVAPAPQPGKMARFCESPLGFALTGTAVVGVFLAAMANVAVEPGPVLSMIYGDLPVVLAVLGAVTWLVGYLERERRANPRRTFRAEWPPPPSP